jgi:hypothetical protein
MSVSEELVCPHDTDDEILRQYAAGILEGEAAEVFEGHLFGCDRCDQELRRILEVRAALSPAQTVVAPPIQFAPKRVSNFPLAAAAAVVLVLGLGFWQMRAPRPVPQEPMPSPPPVAQDTMRGPEAQPLVASGSFAGESFTATWKPPRSNHYGFAGKPFQRSHLYLVQFFGEDGAPLYSVTTGETSVTAALTGPMQVGAFYWNVQALDADGVAIARSELQKAVRLPGK